MDPSQQFERPINILTVDVEDWQQSESDVFYGGRAHPHGLDGPGNGVIAQTRHLLDVLDEFGARATCFVLGSVAEAHPTLVREIAAEGHEIGIHGHGHKPVYTLNAEAFRADVARALATMEDCIGGRVYGYRAPYFSITRRTPWALHVLAEMGLAYDASIFPCNPVFYRVPGWDGWSRAPRFPHTMVIEGQELVEVPATTLQAFGLRLPLAGGTALRVAPVSLIRRAIAQANALGHPGILYLHPHDLDRDTPPRRLDGDSLVVRWVRWQMRQGRRHTAGRLRELLEAYRFLPIREWLAESFDATEPLLATQAQEVSRVP